MKFANISFNEGKWASCYISLLKNNSTARFRLQINNQNNKLPGQLIIVEPLKSPAVVGDFVLCSIGNIHYLSKIISTPQNDHQIQIIDSKKSTKWCDIENVFGIVVAVLD